MSVNFLKRLGTLFQILYVTQCSTSWLQVFTLICVTWCFKIIFRSIFVSKENNSSGNFKIKQKYFTMQCGGHKYLNFFVQERVKWASPWLYSKVSTIIAHCCLWNSLKRKVFILKWWKPFMFYAKSILFLWTDDMIYFDTTIAFTTGRVRPPGTQGLLQECLEDLIVTFPDAHDRQGALWT